VVRGIGIGTLKLLARSFIGRSPNGGAISLRWLGVGARMPIHRPTHSQNTHAVAKASDVGIAFVPVAAPHPDGSASLPYRGCLTDE
jgi:hypothetical protein